MESPARPVGCESEPLVFFRRVHTAYGAAVASGLPETTVYLAIDHFVVRVHIVGADLSRRYLPALDHLRTKPVSPDLCVLAWDAAATGVQPPSPAWRASDQVVRGELPRFCDERVQAAYNIESGVLNVISLHDGLAVQCVRSAEHLPQYEYAAPLRDILGWWAVGQDCQLLHAGAVGHDHGGVLLVGRGGTGKSSTTAACLAARLRFVSDDYCFVRLDHEPAFVSSLYGTLKLPAADVERLQAVHALPFDACLRTGKHLFWLGGLRPTPLTRGFPVRAILLPRITGATHTRLTPVSAAACLRALAPSTLLQLPAAGRYSMALMGRIVRAAPTFALELGSDRAEVAGAIVELLEASP